MAYKVTPTPLEGVLILEPQVFGDSRGFFFESFNAKDFANATGIDTPFVQDNHSKSAKGVLRGLHYQDPKPQGKLVRVSSGEVFDVAVDIRPNSKTCGKWFGIHLSDNNKLQLWIAPGFAHGFLVLSQTAEFLYKTTDYWYPEHEQSLAWNDPTLSITWPLDLLATQTSSTPCLPTLAPKDERAMTWVDMMALRNVDPP